jgi:hypothetical protein
MRLKWSNAGVIVKALPLAPAPLQLYSGLVTEHIYAVSAAFLYSQTHVGPIISFM